MEISFLFRIQVLTFLVQNNAFHPEYLPVRVLHPMYRCGNSRAKPNVRMWSLGFKLITAPSSFILTDHPSQPRTGGRGPLHDSIIMHPSHRENCDFWQFQILATWWSLWEFAGSGQFSQPGRASSCQLRMLLSASIMSNSINWILTSLGTQCLWVVFMSLKV